MKMRAFETRKGTQLAFSAIRLGTAPLGEIYEILDERTSIATVEQALASGVRLFDTSPHTATDRRIPHRRGASSYQQSDVMVSYQDRPSDGSLREAATAQQEVYSPGLSEATDTRRASTIRTMERCDPSSNRCFARASVRSTSCSMTATSGPMVARPGAASPRLVLLC